MTGIELYALYEKAQGDLNNCIIDDWEALGPEERAVWNALAAELQLRG